MLAILLLMATVFATSQAYSVRQANAYIDFILREPFIKEAQYSRIDPYKVPDIHVSLISRRITDNEAKLTKGSILNLSRVRRSGDCSVPLWQSANVTFNCVLQFPGLAVNYTANVTYDSMQLIFYPKADVRDTEVSIQITTTKEENIPNLKLFFVTDVGHMKVTTKMITIGDISNVITPPIRDAILEQATTNMHKALNGRFKDALAFSIYKTPVPFVGDFSQIVNSK
ncbi:uncharacterized protein [Parasteatoda tepidariorum]|uniref:uncharacterized protein n=1 Tax=Parasteatoda tepidariorum TaxID=114398 RepID=UPI00077F911C|nr:uncharacterized protein LOC107452630 [Parasteatoda tepidariorum]XP_042910282.1 uncharacterized protein LOC107452630 [Parasteatoda tepidariorum]